MDVYRRLEVCRLVSVDAQNRMAYGGEDGPEEISGNAAGRTPPGSSLIMDSVDVVETGYVDGVASIWLPQ